jgi:hypothetical protein
MIRRPLARLTNALRDPYTASVALLVVVGVGGVLAIVLAAAGIADAATLDLQLPYLASGGVGGLAMVIVATGLGAAQRRRLARAREREALATVLAHADALLNELRDRPPAQPAKRAAAKKPTSAARARPARAPRQLKAAR